METTHTVGTGTASSRMKSRWKKANSHMSFKRYLHQLVQAGDDDAKECLATKQGKRNMKPSQAKLERISAGKFATPKKDKK